MSCQGGINPNLHMATTLCVSPRQYQVPQPRNHVKHATTHVIRDIGLVEGLTCTTKFQGNGAHTHATTKSNVGKKESHRPRGIQAAMDIYVPPWEKTKQL
jgi:hypothetical protein